jgi:hypothetical protein
MSTMRDSFRMCLRLYIWKLVRAEKAAREWSAMQAVPTPEEENAD